MPAATRKASALPPLALYVHVPWCVRKCPYCDFNSHGVGRGAELPEAEYLAALFDDLDADLPLAAGRPLVSIFIGGGTPSLMSADFYARFLEGLTRRLPLDERVEITLEANPGTLERGRFLGYRRAGINRLSLGVQSFQSAQLGALGRIHSGDDAVAAVAEARTAGFDNLNLDLMHGLPGQTPELALADLERALALAPEHLSWYQLTLEPNTEFHSRPPVLPEEELLWEIQDLGHERLEAAGLSRYEISAYAQPGRRSRHNLNYWRFGDYLGIGAGSHGKLSAVDESGRLWVERRWKTRQPEAYLRRRRDPRGFVAGSSRVDDAELPLEFAMNALRLVDGVAMADWPAHTGRPLAVLSERLAAAYEKGLLVEDRERLQASPRGLLFLNELLALVDDAGTK
ncbi:radical SAM family heme chaperone HemW [Halomonas sp. MCCC 1A17488]|uniref:Heme chaperone HemW n=1 Tax=Billgrantia sulfidoxydans TaxID=2733484 RepID=A0ABX7WCU4_9GAMM|nr:MULTISPECIES: radical SAM family heme chaperone HemW [Halomonas]MCE8017263.1 radical SAM family heme chaperone HemW [Halomonas sp. MCCC 1A17488]MCG3240596.1 radical SAM family heme chaperone HemW [Halomonas sp. MCCC 1A17488]QPP49552.1 radical SAM family heme chaperone HemW [Halomonas sp. SS10-MC5]QTP56908.1 radical SAM family heme chaperone HemW [Halomonas sulfidoxydans]